VPEFRELAAYLRDNNVTCHFTAGGHYPSLRCQHVMRDVPQLDSVVRFEGEMTLVDLMLCLAQKRDWRQLAGIAYREGDKYVANPARPLITDLDKLPFPARTLESSLVVLGHRASPILGSRGCSRNCSFCSIRQFYGEVPGKKVRVRNPVKVVEEMRHLYEENGVSIFLFLDDDFPVWGAFGRRWVAQFIAALGSEGLLGRVLWKISCRCDEVEPELFARMRDAGLYVVYLGIESGNAAGLSALNKQLTVDANLRAAAILNDIGLAFTYGFMLFDPSSTFDSVRENVTFLRRITAGGNVPVVFCRMLPYAGTPIEATLAKEGRLRGSVENPDYDFLDLRLNSYFEALNRLVAHWMNGTNAVVNQINFAWHEYWVLRRLFSPLPGILDYETFLRSVTSRNNDYLLNLVEQVALVFEDRSSTMPSLREVQDTSLRLSKELLAGRNTFICDNEPAMLASLEAARHPQCVGAA